MTLNLRNLAETYNQRLSGSFFCHGQRFTSIDYRQKEAGYQDFLAGIKPQSDNLQYRRGYLDAICDNGDAGR